MATKIVTATWTEPENGIHAEVWSLTGPEWAEIQTAIEWIQAYWEKHENSGDGETAVGETIAEYKIHDTTATKKKPDPIGACMDEIALQLRYTSGEELYEEDCPIFKKHGIERS